MRPDVILRAFAHRGLRLVAAVEAMLGTLVATGMSFHDAWNQALVEIRRAADAHVHHAMLDTFVSATSNGADPSLSPGNKTFYHSFRFVALSLAACLTLALLVC